MNELIFIKACDVTNVRLTKFLKYLVTKGYKPTFWGWDRDKTNKILEGVEIKYIFNGFGYGGVGEGGLKLLLAYPIWMFIVFCKLLFNKAASNRYVFAINFDSALPVYLVSKIRKIKYFYEIRDEFALSYKMPQLVKKIVLFFDHKCMHNAYCVIHVDDNRVTYRDCKWIVVQNSPFDYYNGKEKNYNKLKLQFAVIGNVSANRGVDSIYEFAKNNPSVELLLVGRYYTKGCEEKFSKLSNVKFYNYMPQEELFAKLQNCCGIFSLYSPNSEINLKAASNKLYDAMMLGIPTITNPEVENSRFVIQHALGVIVNYNYDDTWSILSSPEFIDKAIEMGKNGRKLYLDKYRFEKMLEEHFMGLLK